MNKIVPIILFLVLNGFFGAFPLSFSIGYSIIIAILATSYKYTKNTIFYKPIIFFLIGLVLSMVSCYYFRQQTIMQSLPSYFSLVGIAYYFYLCKSKLHLKETESLLFLLIVTLDTLYILQYILIQYGINFLSLGSWQHEDVNNDAGGIRIRVVSSGLYSLGLFYGLVKWTLSYKIKYLVVFALGILIMLLSGFRQIILSLGIAMIFTYFIYRKNQKKFKIFPILVFSLILCAILFIPAVQEKINGMIFREDSGATFDNNDYIRVTQFMFYHNDMFINNIERFFGFGIPAPQSSFGRYYSTLQEIGLVYVDWGIIGGAWSLGIITAGAVLWFSIKAIRRKVAYEYSYVSIWYVYLLSASITNWEMFRNGNFLVHSIALYIVCLASRKYNDENCILSK